MVGHRGNCAQRRKSQAKASEQHNTKKVGLVVSRFEGVNISAAPAPGPARDLTKARVWSGNQVNNSARNEPSTCVQASCCHPLWDVPGSRSSGSLNGGCSPSARAAHDGGANSIFPVSSSLHLEAACKNGDAGSPSSSVTSAAATCG